MRSVGADAPRLAGRRTREQITSHVTRRQPGGTQARNHQVAKVLAYAAPTRENVIKFLAKGKGIANPAAIITAATMMLRHINEHAAANRIDAALEKVLWHGDCLTRDLGGTATTKQFAAAIITEIER